MDGSALFRHLERTRLSAEVPGTERTLVSAENRGKVKLCEETAPQSRWGDTGKPRT